MHASDNTAANIAAPRRAGPEVLPAGPRSWAIGDARIIEEPELNQSLAGRRAGYHHPKDHSSEAADVYYSAPGACRFG